MKLSNRYTGILALALGITLIPVLLHSYFDVQTDECADPFLLIPATHQLPSEQERNQFMDWNFSAHQWKEGTLPTKLDEPQVSWITVRTYDAKKLYYRATTRLLGQAPDTEEQVWIEGNPPLPVWHSTFSPDPGGRQQIVSSHLLIYDGAPVENPYRNQLLAAPLRLFRGNLPMTLFMASSRASSDALDEAKTKHDAWILQAWQNYRKICFP